MSAHLEYFTVMSITICVELHGLSNYPTVPTLLVKVGLFLYVLIYTSSERKLRVESCDLWPKGS